LSVNPGEKPDTQNEKEKLNFHQSEKKLNKSTQCAEKKSETFHTFTKKKN
jgi:hypothetical protein